MSNFILSLEITALGMSLVFGSIILLWGMTILLTRLTAEKMRVLDASAAGHSTEIDYKRQAAALAVVIALAEQELSTAHALSEPPTAIVSAWQLGMRTRQMSEKGQFGRHAKE